jgi:hypothetical protein
VRSAPAVMHTATAAAPTCCRDVDSCSVTSSSIRSSRLMPGDLRPAILSAQQRCCGDPRLSSGVDYYRDVLVCNVLRCVAVWGCHHALMHVHL